MQWQSAEVILIKISGILVVSPGALVEAIVIKAIKYRNRGNNEV